MHTPPVCASSSRRLLHLRFPLDGALEELHLEAVGSLGLVLLLCALVNEGCKGLLRGAAGEDVVVQESDHDEDVGPLEDGQHVLANVLGVEEAVAACLGSYGCAGQNQGQRAAALVAEVLGVVALEETAHASGEHVHVVEAEERVGPSEVDGKVLVLVADADNRQAEDCDFADDPERAVRERGLGRAAALGDCGVVEEALDPEEPVRGLDDAPAGEPVARRVDEEVTDVRHVIHRHGALDDGGDQAAKDRERE
mmetsp:Transcript_17848/g.52096  ORF Transcript_17848/g.52096 Transcript_17848/m.52096 type:complete len:253 (-) Transcript_17848:798-1556(-)